MSFGAANKVTCYNQQLRVTWCDYCMSFGPANKVIWCNQQLYDMVQLCLVVRPTK